MVLKQRFTNAAVGWSDHGFSVLLDHKYLRSPSGHVLTLPNYAIARAVANEFNAQAEAGSISPAAMPVSQLVFTARDRVMDHMDMIRGEVIAYAGADAVCYWSGQTEAMVARQKQYWGQILQLLEQRFGMKFHVCLALTRIDQPSESLDLLREHLNAMDGWQLTLVMLMTGLTGSALVAFLWMIGGLNADEVFAHGFLPEIFRAELAGENSKKISNLMPKIQEITELDQFRAMLITPSPDFVRLRAHISGKVQGVGYRAWTMTSAKKHGVGGWVRNRADGRVEMELSGEWDSISAMLRQCLQGPMLAAVQSIAIDDYAECDESQSADFAQRETA